MLFISEGVSMQNVYLNKGTDNGKYPTKFYSYSSASIWLREIIMESVHEDSPRSTFSLPSLYVARNDSLTDLRCLGESGLFIAHLNRKSFSCNF